MPELEEMKKEWLELCSQAEEIIKKYKKGNYETWNRKYKISGKFCL